jgi:hypothetical protein
MSDLIITTKGPAPGAILLGDVQEHEGGHALLLRGGLLLRGLGASVALQLPRCTHRVGERQLAVGYILRAPPAVQLPDLGRQERVDEDIRGAENTQTPCLATGVSLAVREVRIVPGFLWSRWIVPMLSCMVSALRLL